VLGSGQENKENERSRDENAWLSGLTKEMNV